MILKKTIIEKVDPIRPQKSVITRAAKIINSGGLVVFPTETVYGLGANALDPVASQSIFTAKNRPPDNPLIVHISNKLELDEYILEKPKFSELLIDRYWPGPLTLIFRKSPIIPNIVTAGTKYVAIRVPNHPVALALIKESGVPIAAPSANLSGRPSPTTAQHSIQDLYGRVDMILDSGPTDIGLESTVLNLLEKKPSILRPGGITREDIFETISVRPTLGYLKSESSSEKVISPGTKHPHYHPKAKVILLDIKNIESLEIELAKQILIYRQLKKSIGILGFEHSKLKVDMEILLDKDYNKIARSLFDSFRRFDDKKIDVILIPRMSSKQIGLAITDRITRAASQIIKVI